MTSISKPAEEHSAGQSSDDRPIQIIRPRSGWQPVDFAEVWRFRDLVWILTLRDVKVRYKQSILGIGWAIIQPVLQMVVFTIFFGKLMGLEDKLGEIAGKAVPYAVFALSGQVFWSFFSSTINGSANSLLSNANIVRKVYVPRVILPIAGVGTPIVDGAIALVVMLGLMAFYGVPYSIKLVLLPLLAISLLMTSMGVGFWLASVNVAYRDFRYVQPYLIQIAFYLTPVIYPVKLLPEEYMWILYLNPMSGVIETVRAAVFDLPIPWAAWGLSAAFSVTLLISGLYYFARVERRFADIA